MWWKGQYMTWLDCIKAVFVLVSNHFRKCFFVNAGVWLHMENKFSGNYFQLTGCFEGFDPKMVWSENFHFKPFLDSRTKREREPSTSSIYEPTNHSSTQSLWPTSLRLRWRPRAFVPRTNLSLCVILIFCVILIDPRAFDLWFFLLLLWWCGWWCFGGFPVVWVVVENSIFRMLPNT